MPPPRPHECTTCHRRFRTPQSLSQHIDANPHPVHACTQCGRTFGSERALRQHVLDSPSHGSHECVDCDRSFQTAQALAQHLNDSSAHQGVDDDEEQALYDFYINEIVPNRRVVSQSGLLEPHISRYMVGFEPESFPLGWDFDDLDSDSDGATEGFGDFSYDSAEVRRLVPSSIIGTPPSVPSFDRPMEAEDSSRGAGATHTQTPAPDLDVGPLALTDPLKTPLPQSPPLEASASIDTDLPDAEALTLEAQLAAEREKNKALERELSALREALKLEKLIRQCGMCYEKTTDTVTKCGHLFCSGCVTSWQEQHHPPFLAPCPMCRSPMGKARRVFRE
ncbi:peroxisome biogenesis factor 10 [Neonectria punicea]|uniref:Peroxisome biogenesis factor 10 n=1 Tax=Neonectria punicea TaxID=979145 RepID=A0ABR1H9P0_9HYPO